MREFGYPTPGSLVGPVADAQRAERRRHGEAAQPLERQDETELAKRIEAGLYASVKRIKMLSVGPLPEHQDTYTRDLAWLAQDGERAKAYFLEANDGLARKHAYNRRPGESMVMDDYVQIARVGLIRALEKFDYKQGIKFSTYSTWWIKQELQRNADDEDRIIRISVEKEVALRVVHTSRRVLTATLGREPTQQEVAKESDMTVKELEKLESSVHKVASFNKPTEEGGDEIGVFIEDSTTPSTDEAAMLSGLQDQVRASLGAILGEDSTPYKILMTAIRQPDLTREQIGKLFGISVTKVGIIRRNAYQKIRSSKEGAELREYLDEDVISTR